MNAIHTILLASLSITVAVKASDYRVDSQLGKGTLGEISQLTVGQNDTICALESNGKVTVFDETGGRSASLATGMNNTTAITADAKGNFYILATLTEEKKVKVGARMRKIQVPTGVECGIFAPDGTKIKTYKLDQLKSAQSARIVSNKLIVADLTARALVFHDLESGKETARIKKGLRLCCGIFDFCEAPDNSVAISNLGAFKVQRFDMDGKFIMEFGKRGRGMDDFQGCCNPVSAAYLPDGGILTVEKDPTRIKVYDADGKNAVQIAGVEELVKGCSFIPTAVDSKGNIYLAANTKGYIVKCVK